MRGIPMLNLARTGTGWQVHSSDLIPASTARITKPAGQWNKVSIILLPGYSDLIIRIPGANVVEYHLVTDAWKKMVADLQ